VAELDHVGIGQWIDIGPRRGRIDSQHIDQQLRDLLQDRGPDLGLAVFADVPLDPNRVAGVFAADEVTVSVDVSEDRLDECRWRTGAFTVDRGDTSSDTLLVIGGQSSARSPADIGRHSLGPFSSDTA
jgi:hypothetical protein